MSKNIMIIDDSKIDLFLCQKIIEKVNANCNVRTFASANSALVYLKLLERKEAYKTMHVPDLIFLDINMPEMDGFQFLKEFNKLHRITKYSIKLFILSSSTNPIDIKKAENEKSCMGFISKPLTARNIEKHIVEYRPYLKRFDAEAGDVNFIFKENCLQ